MLMNFFRSLFKGKRSSDDGEYPDQETTVPESAMSESIATRTVLPEPDAPEPAAQGSQAQDIVLSIPGIWPDWSSFVDAMAGDGDGDFLIAGRMLYHRKAKFHMDIVFEGSDPELESAFREGAGSRMTEPEFAAIGAHRSVVSLTAATGSMEHAFAAVACAGAVLLAGGIAVKVDTAGGAFNRDIWAAIADDEIGFTAAFLELVREKPGSIRSYGLRAFGLRDVQCEGDYPDAILDFVINTFIKSLLFENQNFIGGETFSPAPEAPVFRLNFVRDEAQTSGPAFHNPYGVIRLEQV